MLPERGFPPSQKLIGESFPDVSGSKSTEKSSENGSLHRLEPGKALENEAGWRWVRRAWRLISGWVGLHAGRERSWNLTKNERHCSAGAHEGKPELDCGWWELMSHYFGCWMWRPRDDRTVWEALIIADVTPWWRSSSIVADKLLYQWWWYRVPNENGVSVLFKVYSLFYICTIYRNITYQLLFFSSVYYPILHIPCHLWLHGA